MAKKLPINTPFKELPSIFQNWNKQTTDLQLTNKQLSQLIKDKKTTIPIKFYFPNIHNKFLANKMYLNLNLSIDWKAHANGFSFKSETKLPELNFDNIHSMEIIDILRKSDSMVQLITLLRDPETKTETEINTEILDHPVFSELESYYGTKHETNTPKIELVFEKQSPDFNNYQLTALKTENETYSKDHEKFQEKISRIKQDFTTLEKEMKIIDLQLTDFDLEKFQNQLNKGTQPEIIYKTQTRGFEIHLRYFGKELSNERTMEIPLTNKDIKDLRKKKQLPIQLFLHKVILKHVKK